MTWMITDEHGNELAAGLQGPEVSDELHQIAQRMANERGRNVYASLSLRPSDESDELDDEIVFSPAT